MNKKQHGAGWRFSAYCLLFLIMWCATTCPAQGEAQQPAPGPDDGFSLKSTDGERISLNDYRGKKVVHLMFWATWCPHCLIEMTKIRDLHTTLDSASYELLAIDVGVNDTLSRIKKIQSQYQIPCKILIDEKGEG